MTRGSPHPAPTTRHIAALLTPRGRGAVAVVAIQGACWPELLERLFQSASGRSVAELPMGRLAFGRWRAPGTEAGEEVVLARLAVDRWEVHCHGGEAAAEAILAACEDHGAERVEPAAAIPSLADDRLSGAALPLLPSARTPRTAALLLAQLQGALRHELQALAHDLASDRLESALARVGRLHETRDCGLHLTTPWRVAIVGRPNAGKSSLINRLVGYQRAIVADEPGTTRDVVTAITAWDGWPLEFADTAGVRATSDALEAAGVERAWAARSQADLVVYVTDLTVAWNSDDQALWEQLTEPIIVHNKCDAASWRGDRPEGNELSALTGIGVERLLDTITRRLVPCPPPPGAPLLFTPDLAREFDALRMALERRDICLARQWLADWLG